MAEVRITCINKDGGNHSNPHEAISDYGWTNFEGKKGISDRPTMVKWIEDGNTAYVEDKFGNRAYCGVRKSVAGNKFLQTFADTTYTDNLLNLLEC